MLLSFKFIKYSWKYLVDRCRNKTGAFVGDRDGLLAWYRDILIVEQVGFIACCQ